MVAEGQQALPEVGVEVGGPPDPHGVDAVPLRRIAASPRTPAGGRSGQGASRVAPGKSGLHVRGEGECIIALELW